MSFKNAITASLKSLNLNDISLLANLNEKSELNATATLNSINANGLKIDETSKNLVNLKDINASNLNANLANSKTTLTLEKIAFDDINAPLSKNANANVTGAKFSNISFTQDTNKSLATLDEISINGINLKAKNKEILDIANVLTKTIKFDILNMALSAENIDVNRPKFNSELNDSGLSVINQLGLGEKEPAKTANHRTKTKKENTSASKSKENEFKFDIKNINVNNASIALTHLFEGEKIAHKFDNLFVKIANLSSDFSKPFDAKVDIKSSQ